MARVIVRNPRTENPPRKIELSAKGTADFFVNIRGSQGSSAKFADIFQTKRRNIDRVDARLIPPFARACRGMAATWLATCGWTKSCTLKPWETIARCKYGREHRGFLRCRETDFATV